MPAALRQCASISPEGPPPTMMARKGLFTEDILREEILNSLNLKSCCSRDELNVNKDA